MIVGNVVHLPTAAQCSTNIHGLSSCLAIPQRHHCLNKISSDETFFVPSQMIQTIFDHDRSGLFLPRWTNGSTQPFHQLHQFLVRHRVGVDGVLSGHDQSGLVLGGGRRIVGSNKSAVDGRGRRQGPGRGGCNVADIKGHVCLGCGCCYCWVFC